MTSSSLAVMTAIAPQAYPRANSALSPQSNIGSPTWLPEVYHRLKMLSRLQDGWDSRGSAAVNTDAVTFALEVLGRVMPPTAAAPSITPLGHGGLQLSWQSPSTQLDLEVIAPNKLFVCFEDLATGEEHEWSASTELSLVQYVLWNRF